MLMHLLWCRTRICSSNLSVEGSLMLNDPFFSFISLYFGVCQPLFYPEQHASYLQVVDPLQCKPYYLKMISGVLGCLLSSNITYKFLYGWPVFPDYLFVFYDYGHRYLSYLSGDSLIFFCYFVVCGAIGLLLWLKSKEYQENVSLPSLMKSYQKSYYYIRLDHIRFNKNIRLDQKVDRR